MRELEERPLGGLKPGDSSDDSSDMGFPGFGKWPQNSGQGCDSGQKDDDDDLSDSDEDDDEEEEEEQACPANMTSTVPPNSALLLVAIIVLSLPASHGAHTRRPRTPPRRVVRPAGVLLWPTEKKSPESPRGDSGDSESPYEKKISTRKINRRRPQKDELDDEFSKLTTHDAFEQSQGSRCETSLCPSRPLPQCAEPAECLLSHCVSIFQCAV